MNLTSDQWAEIWKFSPVLLLTLTALYGGWKDMPWWVYGRVHREALANRDKQIEALTQERDKMRDLLIQNLQTTRESLDSANLLLHPPAHDSRPDRSGP